jgi:prepilin-type N-terminal cleavage/methylation domain-containing protein/prepilin-type processing-associated H-X9-DG protein
MTKLRHNRRSRVSASGFTLIELLVVIAIIAVLAAILFPVFSRARLKAKAATCQSNLKQCAMAIIMYAADHEGCGPFNSCGSFWTDKLAGGNYGGDGSHGAKPSKMYECPVGGTYGLNRYRGAKCSNGGSVLTDPWQIDTGVKHPEDVMLVADSRSTLTCDPPYFYDIPGDGTLTAQHLSVNNLAFVDGHVKGCAPSWLKDEVDNASAATGKGRWWYWTL